MLRAYLEKRLEIEIPFQSHEFDLSRSRDVIGHVTA